MMRRKAAVRSCWSFSTLPLLALVGLALLSPIGAGSQQADAARKLAERTAAAYPALARTMALSGTVRLDVTVSPDGSVKEIEIKGGHPVLAQAAVNSVRRWRWEAVSHETHETVEIKFSPE
jgi:TonB family protein